MSQRVHLVQLAGGKGLRAGGQTPKQFRATSQGPLFTISLIEFLGLPSEVGEVVSITVTAPEPWSNVVAATLGQLPPGGYRTVRAEPGATRTESTWSALQTLNAQFSPQPHDLVAVHDAARPFASVTLLAKLVSAAAASGAAVPGIPVTDTILQKVSGSLAAHYLERENLVAVQTPQVFRWELLHEAHLWAAENQQNFTDDGGLVASRGTDPVVIPGEHENWKVTTEGDWKRAVDLL